MYITYMHTITFSSGRKKCWLLKIILSIVCAMYLFLFLSLTPSPWSPQIRSGRVVVPQKTQYLIKPYRFQSTYPSILTLGLSNAFIIVQVVSPLGRHGEKKIAVSKGLFLAPCPQWGFLFSQIPGEREELAGLCAFTMHALETIKPFFPLLR